MCRFGLACLLALGTACGGDNDVAVDGAVGPTRAVVYINPDTGMPTGNPDVEPTSSCATPDVIDAQAVSDTGMTNRNVHLDACLFGAGGMTNLDGQATFESSGIGSISGCPDPDSIMGGANGPKTATASDNDANGANDRCVQSGYQAKGSAGDDEFHARVNNDAGPGTQTVVFCLDANGNGCADETISGTVTINWTQ